MSPRTGISLRADSDLSAKDSAQSPLTTEMHTSTGQMSVLTRNTFTPGRLFLFIAAHVSRTFYILLRSIDDA